MSKLETFSLDEETSEFLDNIRYEHRVAKSQVLREFILYFKKHPKELEGVLEKL